MSVSPPNADQSSALNKTFIIAWFICAIFYFVQYALRSAPSIMQAEIIDTLHISKVEMAGIIGLYFYSYAFFALVSGVMLDRIGPRFTASLGIILVAIGCVLFCSGTVITAQFGRFLQGAGSGLAFTSAVFLATRGFPKKWLATAVGMTQCFGMLGGFMGQAVVSPIIKNQVLTWQMFWMVAAGILVVVFFGSVLSTPRTREGKIDWSGLSHPYIVVLKNPQSYICAFIGAMMFLPTNVGNIAWGNQFLQDGLIAKDDIALRLAMVPLGWVIGCPILGYLSDVIGRRKPVVMGSLIAMGITGGFIVYLPDVMPPFVMGLLFGIASGAAMIPYTMIKEVNPDEVKGTATGVINFFVFVISAIMTNMFNILIDHLTKAEGQLNLKVFQTADYVFVGGLILAFIMTMFVRETGSQAKK
ncbi:MFS transporter [Snodgrassella alvi]|uniref:MFS transporter n=2 Tax=Neisseriaceae TaxID=481 RepID=UPI001C0DD4F7|nr:MFS transporter [Snodgrassella alvi]